MSQLVESIWIKNKIPMNISYHQRRYAKALLKFYPGAQPMDLRHAIDTDLCRTPEVKCRIIYGDTILSVEYETYSRKKIVSLKCVEANDVEYKYKYLHRDALTKLYEKRENCDEIIMVKNGLICDAYYYNLVFENDLGLFTPEVPLLAGTMREQLIANRVLTPVSIALEDLPKYSKIHLINALNPLGCQQLKVASIL